jgi:hypothetical protein
MPIRKIVAALRKTGYFMAAAMNQKQKRLWGQGPTVAKCHCGCPMESR